MKAALLALFGLLKPPLTRTFSSLKFWTVVLGLVSSQAAKYGLEVDEATYWTVVGFFGVLLGAQGLQDHGKEAAKLKGPTVEGVGGDVNLTVTKAPEGSS